MKKSYKAPELALVRFEDVITTSGETTEFINEVFDNSPNGSLEG